MLNAAIGCQALHLKHPRHMLQRAVTTVQRVWAIHNQRPTSLPAEVRAALPLYYGNSTDHLVHSAYTAHTATHLHRLMHNQEPEVREVFTHVPNTSSTNGVSPPHIWNHLQLLPSHHRHVIQTNHRCKEAGPIAVLHTDVGGGHSGDTRTIDEVGTTLHLLRLRPNQMRALQRAGTHHVPFLQHPD